MKKLAICIAFLMAPSVVNAQTVGYFEGSVGATFLPDVDFQSGSQNGTADFDTSLALGLEAGVTGFANDQGLRFGVSWDYFKPQLDSLTFNGQALDPLGQDLDEGISFFAANLYYDLPIANTRNVQPYIGLGAGFATFEKADAQFAASGTLGVRIPISERFYWGGRYRLTYVDGPSYSGLEYEPIYAHTLSALIGVKFN